jgi:hypothetical protein
MKKGEGPQNPKTPKPQNPTVMINIYFSIIINFLIFNFKWVELSAVDLKMMNVSKNKTEN